MTPTISNMNATANKTSSAMRVPELAEPRIQEQYENPEGKPKRHPGEQAHCVVWSLAEPTQYQTACPRNKHLKDGTDKTIKHWLDP
jgi:hypothetical protein